RRVAGGQPRGLARHSTAPSSRTYTSDGTTVYFLASDPQTAEERDRTRLNDDVATFEETTFKQRRLWKVVVSTGAVTQITSGDSSILEYSLSRDGKLIAVQRA